MTNSATTTQQLYVVQMPDETYLQFGDTFGARFYSDVNRASKFSFKDQAERFAKDLELVDYEVVAYTD